MIFNFKSLVKRHTHGETKAIIKTEGHYDFANGGDYIEGQRVEIPLLYAAIVPIPQDEIKQANGGYYSHDAKKLYTYTGLDKGVEIIHNGDQYKIVGTQDYAEHDIGLKIYYIERVGEEDHDRPI